MATGLFSTRSLSYQNASSEPYVQLSLHTAPPPPFDGIRTRSHFRLSRLTQQSLFDIWACVLTTPPSGPHLSWLRAWVHRSRRLTHFINELHPLVNYYWVSVTISVTGLRRSRIYFLSVIQFSLRLCAFVLHASYSVGSMLSKSLGGIYLTPHISVPVPTDRASIYPGSAQGDNHRRYTSMGPIDHGT
jgi:hypothetical protein